MYASSAAIKGGVVQILTFAELNKYQKGQGCNHAKELAYLVPSIFCLLIGSITFKKTFFLCINGENWSNRLPRLIIPTSNYTINKKYFAWEG